MLLIKKIRLVLHLVRGLVTCAVLFPWLTPAQKDRRIKAWSIRLLALCGMKLDVRAAAPLQRDGVMLVCNHISWIDIYAIYAWHPVRFVAKAEIRHWPLVGWLCGHTGTVFLQRESRADARRIMHEIADMLRQGETVAVFPEGTTTDGAALLPFHANLLQAPVSANKPVQPLCLYYEDTASGRHSTTPAYIGDMTLVESIDAILRAKPMTVRLTVGEPLMPAPNAHRRELAQQGEAAVLAALRSFIPGAALTERKPAPPAREDAFELATAQTAAAADDGELTFMPTPDKT